MTDKPSAAAMRAADEIKPLLRDNGIDYDEARAIIDAEIRPLMEALEDAREALHPRKSWSAELAATAYARCCEALSHARGDND